MHLYICKNLKALMFICWSLVFTMAISPARAADGSRVATVALFVSGMGLKVASVFVESSAQDSYNEYLSTAVQAEISKHRDDYTSKHNLSVGMSRTGIGFIGLAILISVLDELDLISQPASSRSVGLRFQPGYNRQTDEATLLFQRRF